MNRRTECHRAKPGVEPLHERIAPSFLGGFAFGPGFGFGFAPTGRPIPGHPGHVFGPENDTGVSIPTSPSSSIGVFGGGPAPMARPMLPIRFASGFAPTGRPIPGHPGHVFGPENDAGVSAPTLPSQSVGVFGGGFAPTGRPIPGHPGHVFGPENDTGVSAPTRLPLRLFRFGGGFTPAGRSMPGHVFGAAPIPFGSYPARY